MNLRTLLLTTVVGAASSQTLPAQNYKHLIEGTVKDSITGSAEPFTTVRLLTTGKAETVATMTSDAEGRFRLGTDAERGNYILEIISLGKAPLRRHVTVGDSVVNVGTLLLRENSTELGEATVTAQRQLVKAEVDRVSYAMKDDPDAQTSSLLDMLRKVPMVTVDGEDNISVNGSSGFKVYVNGKPSQMMSANPSLILKNYPASNVKRVEVITDPGAKYDAEGTSGILNIVTQTETQTSGYTFSPSLNPSNRGISFNMFGMAQFGKLTFSAYYGIGHNRRPDGTSSSERETFHDDTYHLLRSEGTTTGRGTFQYGNIDASYEFDENNLLSVSAGLNAYNGRSTALTSYSMTDIGGAEVYSYQLTSASKTRDAGYNASADFQHTFGKEGQMLTFSYRFDMSPSATTSTTVYDDLTNVPYELEDRYADPDNRSTEHTAQADFTTPLGTGHTLSTGIKYIYRLNRSENTENTRASGTADEFIRDEDNSIDYRHRADIAAAYGEYSLKLGNLSTRAGVRYEWSRFDVSYPDGKREAFTTDFSDLVPSLNLSYNLSPTAIVKAGYNLRIGRPDISYLSPYVSRPTAETQSYGNPNLDSEKAHNIEASFGTFSQKLNLNVGLTYMLQTDGLTSYSFLDENSVMTTTFGNMMHTKLLRLNVFLNWMFTTSSSLMMNASGSYADYKAYHYYEDATAHNYGFGANGFFGLRQDLPLKLKLMVFGGGGLRTKTLQGTSPGYHFYGLSLSRSFLEEDRLTISANANNFIHPEQQMRSTTTTETFRATSVSSTNWMRFGISIRYRLGGLNTTVKKAARTIENSDVMQQQSGATSESPGAGQDTGGMGQ